MLAGEVFLSRHKHQRRQHMKTVQKLTAPGPSLFAPNSPAGCPYCHGTPYNGRITLDEEEHHADPPYSFQEATSPRVAR